MTDKKEKDVSRQNAITEVISAEFTGKKAIIWYDE
jgi:hypothetical protein